MNHTCHAPGCNRIVDPKMFACKPHWFSLSQKMRDAIWREYRPGQENDKKPSLRYLAVQRLACAHLVFKPHDEKAVLAALPYIQDALGFQRKAIDAGLGDPLEDLIPAEAPELLGRTPTVKKARGRAKRL